MHTMALYLRALRLRFKRDRTVIIWEKYFEPKFANLTKVPIGQEIIHNWLDLLESEMLVEEGCRECCESPGRGSRQVCPGFTQHHHSVEVCHISRCMDWLEILKKPLHKMMNEKSRISFWRLENRQQMCKQSEPCIASIVSPAYSVCSAEHSGAWFVS